MYLGIAFLRCGEKSKVQKKIEVHEKNMSQKYALNFDH